MNVHRHALALALGALTCLAGVLFGHGSGGWGGVAPIGPQAPGDTTPPPPPNPGPGDVAPGGRSGGGAARPSSPGRTAAGPGPSAPSAPASSGSRSGAALEATSWQYWWLYNRAPYLELERAIRAADTVTGSDDFFLGRGGADRRPAPDPLPAPEVLRERVAPALRALLEEGGSSHLLTGAMLSLAKLGALGEEADAATLAALLPFVAHSNGLVAEIAALSVGLLGRAEGAFALAHLAAGDEAGERLCGQSSVPERVRAFAAYGLGLVARRDPRVDVRRFAVASLTSTFDRGLEDSLDLQIACLLAVGLVPLSTAEGHEGSAEAAGEAEDSARLVPGRALEEQVAWALAIVGDARRSHLVRAHAPITAARLASSAPGGSELRARSIERLLEVLEPQARAPREVRQSAVQALGQLADAGGAALDRRARARLLDFERGEVDLQARAFALVALAKIGSRPGSGPEPLEGAADVRAHLLAELAGGKTFARPWAALAIGLQERALDDAGGLGSDESKAALRACFAEARAPELAGACAVGLGLARDAEAVELLRAAARGATPEVRAYALLALGMLRDRASVPALQSILAGAKYQPGILLGAAIGLALLQDPELVERLEKLLDEGSSLTARGAICGVLGQVGDARALDALFAWATDASSPDIARGIAIEALGALADRELLPWNAALSVDVNYRASVSSLSDPSVPGVLDLY